MGRRFKDPRWGARQHLQSARSAVRAEPVRRSLPTIPELLHGLVVTQMISAELQDGFGTIFGPELLGAFDTPTDHLHSRFNVAAGDGQAIATIAVVVHLVLMVLQVG